MRFRLSRRSWLFGLFGAFGAALFGNRGRSAAAPAPLASEPAAPSRPAPVYEPWPVAFSSCGVVTHYTYDARPLDFPSTSVTTCTYDAPGRTG
jgi:hypothetical protein